MPWNGQSNTELHDRTRPAHDCPDLGFVLFRKNANGVGHGSRTQNRTIKQTRPRLSRSGIRSVQQKSKTWQDTADERLNCTIKPNSPPTCPDSDSFCLAKIKAVGPLTDQIHPA